MSSSSENDFIPFALPEIEHDEIEAVCSVLRSGWLTTGRMVRSFEEKFASALGMKHAVAVNSCTAALHLALEAIGLEAGDEVITSPYTFAATAEVIRYFDAKPIFVDIKKEDFNIDPGAVCKAVSPKTKAILPVHIAGVSADMNALRQIAGIKDLKILEDAAHAFPGTYDGKPIGTFGDVSCFSFYATKTITTGEGGMLCTNDEALASRCRLMSLHGISSNAWNRYAKEGSWYYEIIAPGFKYNMTDIAASIGLVQLMKAEQMRKRRESISKIYSETFGGLPELECPTSYPNNIHPWHLYMLRLNLGRLRIDRAKFIELLKRRGVGASVHFIPLHLHPYYKTVYGFEESDFPVALEQYKREVSLPIYSKMTDEDVDRVVNAVSEIVRGNSA